MTDLFYNSGQKIMIGDTVQYTIGHNGQVVGVGSDVELSATEILVSSEEFGLISVEVDDMELVFLARSDT